MITYHQLSYFFLVIFVRLRLYISHHSSNLAQFGCENEQLEKIPKSCISGCTCLTSVSYKCHQPLLYCYVSKNYFGRMWLQRLKVVKIQVALSILNSSGTSPGATKKVAALVVVARSSSARYSSARQQRQYRALVHRSVNSRGMKLFYLNYFMNSGMSSKGVKLFSLNYIKNSGMSSRGVKLFSPNYFKNSGMSSRGVKLFSPNYFQNSGTSQQQKLITEATGFKKCEYVINNIFRWFKI